MSRQMQEQIDIEQQAAEEQRAAYDHHLALALVEFLADFAAGFEDAGADSPQQQMELVQYKAWVSLVQDMAVSAGVCQHSDFMTDEERKARDAYYLSQLDEQLDDRDPFDDDEPPFEFGDR